MAREQMATLTITKTIGGWCPHGKSILRETRFPFSRSGKNNFSLISRGFLTSPAYLLSVHFADQSTERPINGINENGIK